MAACRWPNCDEEELVQDRRVPRQISVGLGYCREHWVAYATAKSRRVPDRYVNEAGYVNVRHEGRIIAEHRVIMASILGRPLRRGESVHHRNGDRSDNRPENLELWIGPIRPGVRAVDLICPHCGKPYRES